MRRALAPRFWGAHLLMAFMVAATAVLGLWQYDVSQGHKSRKEQELEQAAPVPLTSLMGPHAEFVANGTGRPVVVSGSWVPSGTVYVENHAHAGVEGYWVATPLAVGTNPTGPAVYIVRGWVRHAGTAPAAPTGPARVVGSLQPPEDSGEIDRNPSDDVLPELRMVDALDKVKNDLYSAYIVADHGRPSWPAADVPSNDGTAGLVLGTPNSTPTAGFTTGLRNFLYALEWWMFGIFAIYVWWRWLRDELAKPDEDRRAKRTRDGGRGPGWWTGESWDVPAGDADDPSRTEAAEGDPERAAQDGTVTSGP